MVSRQISRDTVGKLIFIDGTTNAEGYIGLSWRVIYRIYTKTRWNESVSVHRIDRTVLRCSTFRVDDRAWDIARSAANVLKQHVALPFRLVWISIGFTGFGISGSGKIRRDRTSSNSALESRTNESKSGLFHKTRSHICTRVRESLWNFASL